MRIKKGLSSVDTVAEEQHRLWIWTYLPNFTCQWLNCLSFISLETETEEKKVINDYQALIQSRERSRIRTFAIRMHLQ